MGTEFAHKGHLGGYTLPGKLGGYTVPAELGGYTVPGQQGGYTVPRGLGGHTVPEETYRVTNTIVLMQTRVCAVNYKVA